MSLSILLADDEPLVTEAVKIMLDELQLDIKVIGELHDGNKALRFIRTYQPDVVLLDIRMPKADGFQILETIEREKIDTKVIILSAYRDFEYAQKAIHYGAVEYLTKPIDRNKLAASLQKIVFLHVQENIYQPASTSQAIQNLLNGGESARQQLLQWNLFAENESGKITLCIFLFPQPLKYDTYRRFKKQEGKWSKHLYITWINEHYWLLIFKADSSQVLNITNILLASLKEYTVFAGFSSTIPYEKFPDAYFQAFDSVQASFYDTNTVIFTTSNKEFSHNVSSPLLSFMISNGLGEKLSLNMIQEIKVLTDNWFRLAHNENIYPSTVCSNVKSLLNYIMMTSVHFPPEATNCVQISIDKLNWMEQTQYYTHLNELREWLHHVLDNIILTREPSSDLSDAQRIVRKAKSYCERHYSEDISLEDVSNEVHITKSWFCSLFKKETGETFGNYLTNLRLRKASVSLASSEKKINQIAEDVGYKNASSFNRAFAEKYHVTPLEYRRSHWAGSP